MAYATVDDLAGVDYFGAPDLVPDNAEALLSRAARRIDHALIGAWYPVDDNGDPTVQKHIDALRVAVCEQVLWWIETGDNTGLGAQNEWQSISIGRLNLSRAGRSGNSTSSTGGGGVSASTQAICQGAYEALHGAGLIPFGPYLVG